MNMRLFALVLVLAAPAYAQEAADPVEEPASMPAEEAARMPATPEEVDSLFGEYWNAGNLEALGALYEPDAVLVGPDGSLARGPEAIRQAIAEYGIGAVKIEMKVVKSAPAGENLVILFNHWTIRGENEDGTPLEVSGKAMEIVRRQADGTWRFVFDHPSAGDGVGWEE